MLEHGRLKRRPPCAEQLEDGVSLRLHDKMDVCWSMRPEAYIYLGGVRETYHDRARAVKQRSHLGRFVRSQVRDPYDVTQRLDQKGPNSKRSDAVLNAPMVALMDRTTWEIAASVRQVTSDAPAHVYHNARIADASGSPFLTWETQRRVQGTLANARLSHRTVARLGMTVLDGHVNFQAAARPVYVPSNRQTEADPGILGARRDDA